MHASIRSRFLATLISLIAAVALALPLAAASSPVLTAHAAPSHTSINCSTSTVCTEVQDSEEAISHQRSSILTGPVRATRWCML